MSSPSSERNRRGSALVTGAGGGIGRQVCLILARTGHPVAAVDLDEGLARETADLVRAEGGTAWAGAVDVTSFGALTAAVSACERELGEVEVFVQCAGVEGVCTPLIDYPEDAFGQVMDINAKGVFLGLRAVLPGMIARGRGAVVNVASGLGLRGAAGMGAYVASKHAVIGLTKTAAIEVAAHGVRVNAVCPGPVATRMMQSLEEQLNPDQPRRTHDAFVAARPMARYASPEEIAEVVAFLCDPRSSYVTGAAWTVDGGLCAR